MPVGYTRPLYILPFDHRDSFVSKLFGWTGALSAGQTERVSAAKRVIYDGFLAAVAGGIDKRHAGILFDEHFGAKALMCCAKLSPNSKSNSSCPLFSVGAQVMMPPLLATRRISAPKFCKVLVRYNPEGDANVNRRQASRLQRLSEVLVASPSRFMFELLVPATPQQLETLSGDVQAYDRKLRPALMLRAISELQDAGVAADVWKVEGLDSRGDCERIVAMARRDERDNVGCIVLGRGENEQQVRTWLTTTAGVPGFIGFAVGRTTFWEPLVNLRDGNIDRSAAVAEIARRFRNWVDIFEAAKALAGTSPTHG